MIYALRNRGTDQTGAYMDNWIALAQLRLSIIDFNSGSQPIHNEDGSFRIIFNEEILT